MNDKMYFDKMEKKKIYSRSKGKRKKQEINEKNLILAKVVVKWDCSNCQIRV